MIAVRLEGRMGNQLFQYAFIYSAAKKLNTKFYIDKSIDCLILDKYFRIENDFCSLLDNNIFSINGFKNVFSHYLRWSFYFSLRNLLFLKEEVFSNRESPSSQLHKIVNNRIYRGNFQSEEYFTGYKADIKRLFTIKDIYRKKFDEVFLSLPQKVKFVTVHVRRGDYISHNLALTAAYYHKAIESIHHEDNYYIFVSDDTDFIKAEFGYLTNKYVSENDEITDFQFLINADICILSSSSFSWWGAWLNANHKKQVLASQYWLGVQEKKEYPVGISDHTNFKWINT